MGMGRSRGLFKGVVTGIRSPSASQGWHLILVRILKRALAKAPKWALGVGGTKKHMLKKCVCVLPLTPLPP